MLSPTKRKEDKPMVQHFGQKQLNMDKIVKVSNAPTINLKKKKKKKLVGKEYPHQKATK
jgi:hypothetical protein